MGFEGFWLPENHFAGPAALSAPLILLAAAAARTSTIDLGTTSLVLPIRHPVSVAEEVAMLDQIAQGRLILGLGRGFSEDLFDVFGVDPREKRALFKQSLTRMLTIWSGEAIHHKDDRGCTSPQGLTKARIPGSGSQPSGHWRSSKPRHLAALTSPRPWKPSVNFPKLCAISGRPQSGRSRAARRRAGYANDFYYRRCRTGDGC